jgi:hypothetical protein
VQEPKTNTQLALPLSEDETDETMWNGKTLVWEDVFALDKDEIISLCEENPVGMGVLISEEFVGNR